MAKEQGQFGWLYDSKHQAFYAVTELPKTLKKSDASAPDPTIHSSKDATKDLPKPLTAEQLGRRFRNPDGFGWHFDKHKKIFVCLGKL